MRKSALALTLIGAVALIAPNLAEARPVRGAAATHIARPGAGGAGTRANIADRTGNRAAVANRSGNRINTGDVRIGNNTNINIDNDGWRDWDDRPHPIAAGVAFGTAAAVTSAVVGSMIYSLPPACAPRPYAAMTYYYCGNVWYEPRYEGDRVVYVVVNQPY